MKVAPSGRAQFVLTGRQSQGMSQTGAALMIMMLIMILGTSWALVGAVTQASRNTLSEQTKTGESLRLAKDAVLGYLAQQALTSDVPGSFPCPEAPGSIGTTNEGTKGNPAAGNPCATLPVIGRLPWKELGIDKPLDGAGEALWYVVGPGARTAPINFSTTGSLTVDGAANAAVALIIAPGVALNSLSNPSTAPSPCVKRNQLSGRNVSPLNSSDFVECGNASLAAFASSRNDVWGNDRVVTISALEMIKAIEGAVADRIQRVVAPILNGTATSTYAWYQNVSNKWGGVRFFPYASTWSDPTSNASCGNFGVTEGLLPLASGNVASGTGCSARWTSATATKLSGSGSFSGAICSADTVRMRCEFTYKGSPEIEVTTTAPNIAMGFRTPPTKEEITFTPGLGNAVTPLSPAIIASNGSGQLVFRVTMADRGSTIGVGRINIPHSSDSILLNTNPSSNPDLAWFINNAWQRYTYYGISSAVTANPSGVCTSVNVTNCLTLTNAEAGTGNLNDKRLVLILSGRPLSGKTQPSANRSDYFELQNDQTTTTGDNTFQRGTISNTFNDRPAVCPFERQTTGSANVLCN